MSDLLHSSSSPDRSRVQYGEQTLLKSSLWKNGPLIKTEQVCKLQAGVQTCSYLRLLSYFVQIKHQFIKYILNTGTRVSNSYKSISQSISVLLMQPYPWLKYWYFNVSNC